MIDEAEDAPPPFRRQVAAWVSVAAHSFVLIPVLVAVVTASSLPPHKAAAVVGAIWGYVIRPARSVTGE